MEDASNVIKMEDANDVILIEDANYATGIEDSNNITGMEDEDPNNVTGIEVPNNVAGMVEDPNNETRLEDANNVTGMEDVNNVTDIVYANNITDLEINHHPEARKIDTQKREGRLRSKVWQHFTKLIKEDGTCEKCQCNHCQKLFTCTGRSGTTHLLRHITEGICPTLNKEKNKTPRISSHPRSGIDRRTGLIHWKSPPGFSKSFTPQIEEEYRIQSPVPLRRKLPVISASKSQSTGEAWMNEFRSCVNKLVELTNGRISTPDYSIAAAVKCLNEMGDIIPQSSEMYIDAFEILQDAGERECFVCLPPEPRRRWIQRVLNRHHPFRYGSSL